MHEWRSSSSAFWQPKAAPPAGPHGQIAGACQCKLGKLTVTAQVGDPVRLYLSYISTCCGLSSYYLILLCRAVLLVKVSFCRCSKLLVPLTRDRVSDFIKEMAKANVYLLAYVRIFYVYISNVCGVTLSIAMRGSLGLSSQGQEQA
jgi:hypothetical protein